MKTRLIVLAVPFLLLACVPIPNRRTYAPLVAGTLVRNGAPVAGAQMLLSARFFGAAATAKTDAQGRFKLGPLSKLRLTRSVLGDLLYEYALKIKVPGEEEVSGLTGHGVGYPPEDVQVTCDLSRPVEQGRSKSIVYCSSSEPLPAP